MIFILMLILFLWEDVVHLHLNSCIYCYLHDKWIKIHFVVVVLISLFSLNVSWFVGRPCMSEHFIECRNVYLYPYEITKQGIILFWYRNNYGETLRLKMKKKSKVNLWQNGLYRLLYVKRDIWCRCHSGMMHIFIG